MVFALTALRQGMRAVGPLVTKNALQGALRQRVVVPFVRPLTLDESMASKVTEESRKVLKNFARTSSSDTQASAAQELEDQGLTAHVNQLDRDLIQAAMDGKVSRANVITYLADRIEQGSADAAEYEKVKKLLEFMQARDGFFCVAPHLQFKTT